MKPSEKQLGGQIGVFLHPDLVLAVNPRVTFRWSPRSAEANTRSRNLAGAPDESVGLATLRAEERTLLALADGSRSIDDLAQLAGISGAVAVRHLRALYDRGVLVPADSLAAKAPASTTSGWSDDTLAPAGTLGAVGSAALEYEYASSEAVGDQRPAVAKGASDCSGPVVTVPSEDIAGRDGAEGPASNLSPGGVVAPVEPSPLVPEAGTFHQTKKVASGPNATMFWIPSQAEPVPPAAVGGDPLLLPAKVFGETTTHSRARRNSPEATVVVTGSPASGSGASFDHRVAPEVSSPPGPSDVSAATGSRAPFRVGAYEVATRIAQGAMASFYVCRRVGAAGFQRLFTLKVVRQHTSEKEEAVRSFMQEARIGALLNHPNVLTLVDVGSYEGQPFLILDYIEGTSLLELLADGRRPAAPVVISILLDVLRGLQHVHDVVNERGVPLGLIHGDISPQNVLVGADGAARLTDFGSARSMADRHPIDADRVAMGKPAYMAPEHFLGAKSDARTDLFSVGIVMWEALTGCSLFAADTYDETVVRVMRRRIPPPSEFGAPPSLDAIVLRALSRSPDGRYSSAEEMAQDIMKAASAETLVAAPRDVGRWVMGEIGERLTDRRRTIQEMFGRTDRTPDSEVPVQVARPRQSIRKIPDALDRIPQRTMQVGALAARELASIELASRDRARSNRVRSNRPRSLRVRKTARIQWVVVILSAVGAAFALAVSISYALSSMKGP